MTFTITYKYPPDMQRIREAADILGYHSLEEFVQVAAMKFAEQTIWTDRRFKEFLDENAFKLDS